MELLRGNREKRFMIFLSSNCIRLVAALSAQIPVIPIIYFPSNAD